MTTGQRILLNALATYGRTLLAIFLGLFSSRWVLAALGEVDYGLMGVVGSILVFITFLNTLSSAANSRYFAFSIGQNDVDSTRHWFNSALSLSIILPTTLVLIGYFAGEIAIRHFLSIPPDRLTTSLWVFRISLITALVTMSCSPFLAMFTAKQNIAELSLWGIAISLTTFTFVFFLSEIPGNKWLIYSVGISSITITFTLLQSLRAHKKYPECKIIFKYWFDTTRIKEMFSYSFWTLFGALGGLFYNNGIAIVLNKFFPPSIYPSVNASYSVGHTVAGQTQNISGALMGAFMPEIVSSEGRGDRKQVIHLMLRAARLTFIIVSLVVLPILFQTEFILTVWLKNPPEYATLFCQTMLIGFLIQKLIGGFDAAICATGKIKHYQIIMSSFAYSTVLVSSVLFYFNYGLTSVCWVIIGYCIINTLGGVYFCKKLVGLSVRAWIDQVVKPVILTLAFNIAIGLVAMLFTDSLNHTLRFFIVTIIVFISTALSSWLWLISSDEKNRIKQMIKGIKTKCCGSFLNIANR